MGDGVFSSKVFGDSGIASEKQFSVGGIEAVIGDPLVILNAPIPKELVVEGLGWRIQNRTGVASKAWPRQSVMYDDDLPARHSNVSIAPGVLEGPFWVEQAARRRHALARHNWAYIVRHSQEPEPGERELAEARQYVRDVQDGKIVLPAEPEPARSATYERSQTAGVTMDESGIGVRTSSDPFNTSAQDEAARLSRISAPPMYRDGEPIDKE